jgi:hypothetical protein
VRHESRACGWVLCSVRRHMPSPFLPADLLSLPSYIVMEIRVDLLDKRAQEPPEHRHLCFVER